MIEGEGEGRLCWNLVSAERSVIFPAAEGEIDLPVNREISFGMSWGNRFT